MQKSDRFERAHGMLLNLAEKARAKRLGGHKAKKPPEGTPQDGAPGEGDDPELGDALQAFEMEDTPAPAKKKGRPF